MGPEFHLSPYGKRFFDSQLPKLIISINRLADAVEKQNELSKTREVNKERSEEENDATGQSCNCSGKAQRLYASDF